jgi:hypothetical protein
VLQWCIRLDAIETSNSVRRYVQQPDSPQRQPMDDLTNALAGRHIGFPVCTDGFVDICKLRWDVSVARGESTRERNIDLC